MPTLRYIAFFLVWIGIITWLLWLRNNPRRRWYAVAPLTWLANVAALYTLRVFQVMLPIEVVNVWSGIITIHALLLAIGGGVVFSRRL